MATVSVTNRIAAPALRGQCVRVYLDTTETDDDLPLIEAGQSVTITSTLKVCRVRSVDTYGNSFQLEPISPADSLNSSSTPGIFAVSETMTVFL